LMTTHLRIQLFGDEFHRDIISMNWIECFVNQSFDYIKVRCHF
jgi:hypothetical protein